MGNKYKKSSRIVIKEKGEHVNGHQNKYVVKRLIREIKHLPMWSNIYIRKFECINVRPIQRHPLNVKLERLNLTL